MAVWIDRFLLACLILVVGILSVTALPFFAGQTLSGNLLLGHMLASGALVVGMPLFALVFLRHLAGQAGVVHRFGYFATVLGGLLTIATVFLCMLPIPSTSQMHKLMVIHGWSGFAMVPAVALLLIGLRITRSASRPHS